MKCANNEGGDDDYDGVRFRTGMTHHLRLFNDFVSPSEARPRGLTYNKVQSLKLIVTMMIIITMVKVLIRVPAMLDDDDDDDDHRRSLRFFKGIVVFQGGWMRVAFQLFGFCGFSFRILCIQSGFCAFCGFGFSHSKPRASYILSISSSPPR